MAYLEELLPEFRKGAKIRLNSWEDWMYIYLNDGVIYDERRRAANYCLCDIYEWFFCPNWELFKEPETDWQYIIDHKCLCWFWDTDESNKRAGILKIISENINVLYWNNYDQQWLNCRPVRRSEITFYEDKEDE